MRNCQIKGAMRLLMLKMRPDTPQKYEFITVENIEGQANSLIYIKPWRQFFDLKGRKDMPISTCENIGLKNINLKCKVFFDIDFSEDYKLSDFLFQNLNIEAENGSIDKSLIKRITLNNVKVNNILIE
jgi:hypothetical protein